MKLTCLLCLVGSAAAFSAVRQQHGARSTALNGAGNMDLWGGKNSLSSAKSIRMMPEEPEPEVRLVSIY
jgi:hypothetical protein